jgi:four helix bundle protein
LTAYSSALEAAVDDRPFQLQARTRKFAVQVIRFLRTLPRNNETRVIGTQLLRCSTSVGANYRAACMARSQADFVSKIGIVCEEADESGYWMDLLVEAGHVKAEQVASLIKEAGELTAIFVASRKTAKQSNSPRGNNRQ